MEQKHFNDIYEELNKSRKMSDVHLVNSLDILVPLLVNLLQHSKTQRLDEAQHRNLAQLISTTFVENPFQRGRGVVRFVFPTGERVEYRYLDKGWENQNTGDVLVSGPFNKLAERYKDQLPGQVALKSEQLDSGVYVRLDLRGMVHLFDDVELPTSNLPNAFSELVLGCLKDQASGVTPSQRVKQISYLGIILNMMINAERDTPTLAEVLESRKGYIKHGTRLEINSGSVFEAGGRFVAGLSGEGNSAFWLNGKGGLRTTYLELQTEALTKAISRYSTGRGSNISSTVAAGVTTVGTPFYRAMGTEWTAGVYGISLKREM